MRRPPRLPDIDRVDDELTVLPLSLTEDGNPPKEWLLVHGRTRRCLACERGMFHGVKHSVTCRKRHRTWLEEQRKNQPAAAGRQGGENAFDVVPGCWAQVLEDCYSASAAGCKMPSQEDFLHHLLQTVDLQQGQMDAHMSATGTSLSSQQSHSISISKKLF